MPIVMEASLEKEPKREVAKRACLSCRTKKIKCDGEVIVFKQNQPRCTNCKNWGIEKCEFVPSRRGGRKPKKVLLPEQAKQQEIPVTVKRQREENDYFETDIKPSGKRKNNPSAVSGKQILEKEVDVDILQSHPKGSNFDAEENKPTFLFPNYAPPKNGLPAMQFLPVNDPYDKPPVDASSRPVSFNGDYGKPGSGACFLQNLKLPVLPLPRNLSGSFPYNFFESKPPSPDHLIPVSNQNASTGLFSKSYFPDHERLPSLNLSTFQSRRNSANKINLPLLKPTNVHHSRHSSSFSNNNPSPNPPDKILPSQDSQLPAVPGAPSHGHTKSLSRILNDIFPKPTKSDSSSKSTKKSSTTLAEGDKAIFPAIFPDSFQPLPNDTYLKKYPLPFAHSSNANEPVLLSEMAENYKPLVDNKQLNLDSKQLNFDSKQLNFDSKQLSFDTKSKNTESLSSTIPQQQQQQQQHHHTRNSSGYMPPSYPVPRVALEGNTFSNAGFGFPAVNPADSLKLPEPSGDFVFDNIASTAQEPALLRTEATDPVLPNLTPVDVGVKMMNSSSSSLNLPAALKDTYSANYGPLNGQLQYYQDSVEGRDKNGPREDS